MINDKVQLRFKSHLKSMSTNLSMCQVKCRLTLHRKYRTSWGRGTANTASYPFCRHSILLSRMSPGFVCELDLSAVPLNQLVFRNSRVSAFTQQKLELIRPSFIPVNEVSCVRRLISYVLMRSDLDFRRKKAEVTLCLNIGAPAPYGSCKVQNVTFPH